MIIANKQTLVQEDGGDLIARPAVSEGLKSDRGIGVPKETEVSVKAFRRRFTAEYKRDILKQTDTCTELGSLWALYTTPQKLDRGLRWIVACRKPEEGRRDENKKDT